MIYKINKNGRKTMIKTININQNCHPLNYKRSLK